MSENSLAAHIESIPFIDHHVHAPDRGEHAIPAETFRRPFTEASIPAVWEGHLQNLVGYRWMVRELGKLLDVPGREADVLAARNAMDPPAYHRLLAGAARLEACYADDLFGGGRSYDVTDWSNLLCGIPVQRVLRVETFIEQCHASCPTLDEALEQLVREIEGAPANGIVSLKSIAGYRVGLAFEPPSASQRRLAEFAYHRLREQLGQGLPARIESKELVDTIVWTALEAATAQALPMQFHVAFGDDDIVLQRNDPALMRALFEHEPFREIPLVLLHCYPYHRQAGYLASIYPNAYVDLGLTIPIIGPGAAAVLAETLELTPTSQLLASSDGHMQPEFQWFASHVWRWALSRVLSQYVDWDVMDGETAGEIAESVLRGNAVKMYEMK